jgi:hypothetical protein
MGVDLFDRQKTNPVSKKKKTQGEKKFTFFLPFLPFFSPTPGTSSDLPFSSFLSPSEAEAFWGAELDISPPQIDLTKSPEDAVCGRYGLK